MWLQQFVDCLPKWFQEAATAGDDWSALEWVQAFVNLSRQVQVGMGILIFVEFCSHVVLALRADRVCALVDPILDRIPDLAKFKLGFKWGQELVGAVIIKVVSKGHADVFFSFYYGRP